LEARGENPGWLTFPSFGGVGVGLEYKRVIIGSVLSQYN